MEEHNLVDQLEHKFHLMQLNGDVLMEAARTNNLGLLTLNNLNVDLLKGSHLNAALDLAVKCNSTECAQWLIQHGADPNVLDRYSMLNVVSFVGKSCSDFSTNGNLRLIELLMPRLKQECKDLMLEEAMYFNLDDLGKYFISKGAQDPWGYAFETAASKGNLLMVKLLCNYLPPTLTTLNKALIRAIYCDHTEVTEYLVIHCGADINYDYGIGLEYAVRNQNRRILELVAPQANPSTLNTTIALSRGCLSSDQVEYLKKVQGKRACTKPYCQIAARFSDGPKMSKI